MNRETIEIYHILFYYIYLKEMENDTLSRRPIRYGL